MHPAVPSGSLFPSAVISLYATYLALSAMSSEPHDYACNGLSRQARATSESTLAVSMVVTMASVVYAALRAGSNTQAFFGEERSKEESSGQALLKRTEKELTSAGERMWMVGRESARWQVRVCECRDGGKETSGVTNMVAIGAESHQ